MKKLLAFILLLPVAVFVIAFAIANRHSVPVSFDPTTTVTGEVAPAVLFTPPVWMLLFGVLVLGVVIGGVAAWASGHRYRREARQKRREARHWHREAESEHERAERLATHERTDAPAHDRRRALPDPANDPGSPERRRHPLPALTGPR